ncbi:MAG: tryptophan 2,3-dioxygenase family protein [Actinomycetota bacterium]|nr:tryptophan 2,3-dioxygenase family protein [Actinomycetota bacterium]
MADLLALQQPLSDPPAHDELLFIVVHQVYELWFKEIAFELETARDVLAAGGMRRARHYLERVQSILKVAIEQVAVLESMSAPDFLEFRNRLAPASGFQSVQFREIEFLSGLKDEAYLERLAQEDDAQTRLRRRLSEPSIWDALCTALDGRGFPMPSGNDAARRDSLLAIARGREDLGEEFDLCEALLGYDELFALWRQRHILMVERQIGSKTGTGGSTGASYLRTTLEKRFFPELWAMRSFL